MQATTIIQVNAEDLRQFAADAYAAGYEKAYQETHEKTIQAKTIRGIARELNTTPYRVKQMLNAGQIERNFLGYKTK